MSIQQKVTLLFFSLTSGVLLLLISATFYFVHEFTFEDFYKRLETRVNIAADINRLNDQDSIGMYKEIRKLYLEKLPSEKQFLLKPLQYQRGEEIGIPQNFIDQISKGGKQRFKKENFFYAGKIFKYENGEIMVIVSASDPSGLNELKNLQKVMTIGFLISLILVFIIGKKFSSHTFKPVRKIIKKVNGITANNLHQRLENYEGNDEISELTITFNDMLDRLETSFETQNNFISNASHELRTPLSIIKGEVELAIKNLNKPSENHQKTYLKILTEAQSLQDILSSLLGMAQTGFDGKKQNWEVIRADELIWLIKDSIDQINPDNKLNIDFSELPTNDDELKILGNINLLKLALSNIVLNACKYSDNKLVVLKVFVAKGSVTFLVKDEGIGIPKEDMNHIFEPFYRASNTDSFAGHGVGLPLSLNIIRLHRGSIGISSEVDKGTEMHILIPSHKRS